MLQETGQDNYVQAPVWFTTTDGVSPKVRTLDNTKGVGEGQIVFADESGRCIEFYNKRLTGSITVEKTLKDIEDIKKNFSAQGNPIFLFKLEKLENLESGEVGEVLGTQTVHVEFDIDSESIVSEGQTTAIATRVINNLEAGYYYRISELNTMRYDQDGDANVSSTDENDDPVTIPIPMTGGLAKATSGMDPIIVRASFTNERTYADYLSDTAVKVNSFTYTPPPLQVSEPIVYKVNIKKGNSTVATKFVTEGDFIDVSKENGIGNHIAPDAGGAIGSTAQGEPFYPHTPINRNLSSTEDTINGVTIKVITLTLL
jgi:hypothetical protein